MAIRLHWLTALTFAHLALALISTASAGIGYYRWPAAHGEHLYFASEGDLWRADLDGANAVRLTTHVEEESSPVVSPDGRLLAFNAHYDGPREVYVMPVSGGSPKQLTYEGSGAAVRGWTPDGKVIYESHRVPGPRKTCVLKRIDPDTLSIEPLPFLGATDVTYADDGEALYLTRFGLRLTGDNTRLYRGGMMAQLWRLKPGADEGERLAPDFGAPIRDPMWWQGRVYFVSDESGDDNLWSVNADGDDPQRHTDFTDWEMRNARLADGVVYFQRGADLMRYDIATEAEASIDLVIATDRDAARLRWIDEPLNYFNSAHPGGEAKSAAVTARGRVAVVFPSPRRRVELNIPTSARARNAVVGPEGDWVYLILDQERFGEIWRFPADGLGEPKQLTEDSDSHIWGVSPSPDGKRVLYTDKQKRLWSLDLKTRVKGLLETARTADDDPFGDFTWAGDGRYVAYSTIDARSIRRVVLRDFENGRREVVTSGKYEAFAPTFSPDGRWLYFVSNRNFSATPSSPWGDRNLGPAFERRGKLYALQLDPKARFPFAPTDELSESDDKADGPNEEQDDDEDKEEENDKEEALVIDFDGVADRLWPVPVDAGAYSALGASANFLYVLDREEGETKLKSVAIDANDPEVETFASGVSDVELSADRKQLFYRKGRSTLAIVPAKAKAPSDLDEHRLRVGSWRLGVVPQEEWRQMLLDAWRMHREFAYDADLRGLDWDAVLDKYLPLVERVGARGELSDLLSQMVNELGILHSQIRNGESPRDEESGAAASLGAEFELIPDGLRIASIYDGEPEFPERLGPLRKPGVDVRVGDVLVAVDGRAVASRADLARSLQSRAGQQVRLDLLRGGDKVTAVATPLRSAAAADLPYRHWVAANRKRVCDESDGKIGYLHLRAMGSTDIASFARDFYEHHDKGAVIIDVRGNRGGNIDSWILSVLSRRAWAFWETPGSGLPEVNMQQAFRGRLAVLIDEGTYSDGETFSAGVKALNLAPLIGTRTAGAGIWLTGRNRLVDGGVARIAEFPQFGLDGRWLIEGHGVSPDIEIVNPPVASYHGADAQLDAAMEHLTEQMQSNPLPKLRGQPLPPLGENGRDVD